MLYRVNSHWRSWGLFPLIASLSVLSAACSSNDDAGDDDSEANTEDGSSDDESDDSSRDDVPSGNTTDDGDTVTGPMMSEEIDEDDVLLSSDDDNPNSSTDDPGGLLENCEGVSEIPEQLRSPVDIIFVIDNSSSMEGEIRQVQDRINDDFARIIEDSGVDYRVIMVARYGDVEVQVGDSDHPICVRAPLGAHDCSDPQNQPLAHNPPRFFHYSADVRSREPWCDVLQGWNTPDELTQQDNRPWESIAPIGWRQFVREEAFKHFVVISDDDVACSRAGYSFNDRDSAAAGENAAIDFDTALLELAPRQFGNNIARNYKWHSIVGLREYDDPLEPWPASEPIVTAQCNPGSEGPGTGFQALSVLTGGLRYPSCNNDNFDAVFEALADGVIRASFACEWAIPDNDDFDPTQLNVRWVHEGGDSEVIVKVEDLDDCGDRVGWYYDDNDEPSTVRACPVTCVELQTDPNARVDLLFGCETVTAVPLAR